MVAFGYWAGYVGAALGVLHLPGSLVAPLTSMAKHELDAALEQAGEASEGFSGDLTPHLLGLAEEGGPSGPLAGSRPRLR